MKKIQLFAFTFCILQFAFSQEYGWKEISANIPDFPFDTVINEYNDTIISQFTDLYFINDDEGWVTSWHPYDSDSAAILHTADGGSTWEVQIVGRACKVIWMLDDETGYAGSQAGGIIYKTTDGGKNWNYHGNTGSTITDISFAPGSDSGYVCSDMNSHFHKITDDEVVATYTGMPAFWKGIAHTDEHLWFCGGGHIKRWNGETMIQIPSNNNGYFQSLYFHDTQHGWVGDQDFIQGYFAPDDIFVVIKVTGDIMISGLHALDKDHLWACLFDGQILHTSNAYDFGYESSTGQGWTEVDWALMTHPRPGTHWDEIFFTSHTNGYVVGNFNRIMKYTETMSVAEKDISQIEFELYPVPASTTIRIRIQESEMKIQEYSIYDLSGHEVIAGAFENEDDIDISMLSSGVYFCKIISYSQTGIKKLIVN